MPDRRTDHESRERIDQLERRLQGAIRRLIVAFLILGVGMTATAFALRFAVGKTSREADERKNETCVLFERQERAAIDQLRRTYDYLRHPSPQLGDLNRLVVAQLPQVEADARASRAPSYCDPSGVGLPGRRPGIPARPKHLP
jgi:hypothetical protein